MDAEWRHCIAVIGAGSWGTALARLLAEKGHSVWLWDREPDRIEAIVREGENARYLPGFPLPERVRPTTDLPGAIDSAGIVVLAVPSGAVREVVGAWREAFGRARCLLSAAKGLEPSSGMTVSQVLAALLGDDCGSRLAVLSGPNLATELARGIPTATVIASESYELAVHLQDVFRTPTFRPYTGADVLGVELGGALKNIIAIAAGVSDGLGYGDNTKASLMTRGLAEMVRLGERLGARRETFYGLSGVGDMITTCAGRLSRNYRVGSGLAQGRGLEEILRDMGQVAEGVPTCEAAVRLADRTGVEMPIARAVYGVLYGSAPVASVTADLMERSAKGEVWD